MPGRGRIQNLRARHPSRQTPFASVVFTSGAAEQSARLFLRDAPPEQILFRHACSLLRRGAEKWLAWRSVGEARRAGRGRSRLQNHARKRAFPNAVFKPASRDRCATAPHKEVFHSSGEIAAGVRARCSHGSPVHAPRGFDPAGFDAAAIRDPPRPLVCALRTAPARASFADNIGASRSITTLAHRSEQPADCPPAERWKEYTPGREGGG